MAIWNQFAAWADRVLYRHNRLLREARKEEAMGKKHRKLDEWDAVSPHAAGFCISSAVSHAIFQDLDRGRLKKVKAKPLLDGDDSG
jgi:hypothetical protein